MINLLIIHFFFSGIESSFILQSKKSKNEKPFIIQAANIYIIQNRNKKLSFYLLLRVDGEKLPTEHRKAYKNKV